MKRISIFLLALALTAALAGSALGVGGTEDDPAVSLSYLEQVFTPELEAVWQRAVYGGLGGVYRDQLQTVTETAAAVRLAAQEASASVPRRASGVLVLKQGDLLVALPGCRVTVKNGVLTAQMDREPPVLPLTVQTGRVPATPRRPLAIPAEQTAPVSRHPLMPQTERMARFLALRARC